MIIPNTLKKNYPMQVQLDINKRSLSDDPPVLPGRQVAAMALWFKWISLNLSMDLVTPLPVTRVIY